MADSRILQLSQRIAVNTENLNSYLTTNQLPQPSFSVDAPLKSTIPQTEAEIVRARQEIINDTLELHQLALGPQDYLMGYSENLLVSQQAVTRFGLAHAFPVGSEITFHDLAATVGLGETHIRKLVRHAITQKIFAEVRPGVIAQRPGLEPKHVVDNYAWASLPQVVDVGGSHGIVAIELARAFPGLQLVVQDLHEHIITDADVQKPTDIAGRVRFMVHDFLTTQPVPAAVYFFRMIFHNWPDKYCVKILRALVPVLQPGARVVVNDAVIAEPCTLPWDQETRLRNSDLNMLELQNAGDRELGEWEGIFRQADERFLFKGGSQPQGSRMWILEAEWKG